MVKLKYVKGNYTDLEIMTLLNSIKELKKLIKTDREFKAFGRMIGQKSVLKI